MLVRYGENIFDLWLRSDDSLVTIAEKSGGWDIDFYQTLYEGEELTNDPTFTTGGLWRDTFNNPISFTGGTVDMNALASKQLRSYDILEIGKRYRIDVTIDSMTAPGVAVSPGGNVINSAGVYSFDVIAFTTRVTLSSNVGSFSILSYCSVKEVLDEPIERIINELDISEKTNNQVVVQQTYKEKVQDVDILYSARYTQSAYDLALQLYGDISQALTLLNNASKGFDDIIQVGEVFTFKSTENKVFLDKINKDNITFATDFAEDAGFAFANEFLIDELGNYIVTENGEKIIVNG